MVLEDFFCSVIAYLSTTHPPIFLPIHIGFYPSKWRVVRSLHKAKEPVTTEWIRTFRTTEAWAEGTPGCGPVGAKEPSQAQSEIKEFVDSPSVLKTSDSDRLANVREMEWARAVNILRSQWCSLTAQWHVLGTCGGHRAANVITLVASSAPAPQLSERCVSALSWLLSLWDIVTHRMVWHRGASIACCVNRLTYQDNIPYYTTNKFRFTSMFRLSSIAFIRNCIFTARKMAWLADCLTWELICSPPIMFIVGAVFLIQMASLIQHVHLIHPPCCDCLHGLLLLTCVLCLSSILFSLE